MGFFARLGLAFGLFFRLLFDAALAARVDQALTAGTDPSSPTPTPTPTPKAAPPQPKAAPEAPAVSGPGADVGALQLLSAFQREGRFVDFVMEDITAVDDADIGAAARMVHTGCKKVVSAWFGPEAVLTGEEGGPVDVPKGFDHARIRLTGNVSGEPPFNGTLAHHGWAAQRVQLPSLTGAADPRVIAAAEVEL